MVKISWKDTVAGWTLKHPECLTTVSDPFPKLMGPASWPGSRVVGRVGSGLPPSTGGVHQEGISFLPRLKTNSLLLSGGQVGPPSTGAGRARRPISLGPGGHFCSPLSHMGAEVFQNTERNFNHNRPL